MDVWTNLAAAFRSEFFEECRIIFFDLTPVFSQTARQPLAKVERPQPDERDHRQFKHESGPR